MLHLPSPTEHDTQVGIDRLSAVHVTMQADACLVSATMNAAKVDQLQLTGHKATE